MFWIVVAAMIAVVGGAIALPLLRGRGERRPAAAYDLQVYRDQLREVGRDRARGVLGEEDAARLRTEIGRKVLDADRAASAAGSRADPRGAALPLALLALALCGSAALYTLDLGAPGRADDPLGARVAAAKARYDARPSQAEAEARAPKPPPRPADPEYEKLVADLRAAVASRPDAEGLTLLVQHEAALGNLPAARAAQEQLLALRGADATATDLAGLAGLMAQAAGGIITPEAEAQIDRALKADPNSPDARFLRGLLLAQNGRPDRTFPIWADLLATAPADLPWMGIVRSTIADLAWLAGQPDYVPPDAAATQAGAPSTPDELAEMAARLEGQLALQGGTAAEWAQLISALAGTGDSAHAAEIWTEARTRFAADPVALATVTDAASKAGLAGNSSPALPGPTAADVDAAGAMTDADRADMIAGMVQSLRDRLTAQGGSGAEWGRLVVALTVQGDANGAREALAQGRAALAGDADGLAALDAAAAQAGLQ